MRRCVICRQSLPQTGLLRFILLEGRYVIDLMRQLPGRGNYVCEQEECFTRLEKWIRKRRRKQQN
ncbi:MAG: YlxR family protein [Candidatus Cloacimonetes bacterium]|nr:YlxR family protein [Candidatus Cloacimonadota bacterium]